MRKLSLNIWPSIFFGTCLLLGSFVFKDFGFAFDEAVQRAMGIDNVKYIGDLVGSEYIKKSERFQNVEYSQPVYPDGTKVNSRFYGVAYEIFLVILEDVFSINDERHIYQIRHLLTYFVFVFGLFSVYSIAKRRFQSWKLGLLAALMIFLTPRFFAESFYNSKDVVFMSLFAAAANAVIALQIKPTIFRAVCAGFLAAIATDVRMIAIILPVASFVWLICRWNDSHPKERLRQVQVFLLFTSSTIIFGILFWPWLWSDPLRMFFKAVHALSHFPQGNLLNVLYFGDVVSSTNLPWHYLPVWIGITIPFVYIPLFFLGLVSIFMRLDFAKTVGIKNMEIQQDIFFLVLAVAPIFMVILLKSVIYDSWRHLYFIYPFLILVMLNGLVFVFCTCKNLMGKVLILVILIITFLSSAISIIASHPLQNVYFNFLIGKNAVELFDVDYWGLSNRTMFEKLLREEHRQFIRIHRGALMNLDDSLRILRANDRFRIVEVESIDDADYILTNFRLNNSNYSDLDKNFSKFYDVIVDGRKVSSIYRRNNQLPEIQATLNNQSIGFGIGGSGIGGLMGVDLYFKNKKGWARPEPWGVWSEGSSASVIIPFPQPKSNVKELVLDVISPDLLRINPLKVSIYVNGKFYCDIFPPEKKPLHVKIPYSYLRTHKGFVLIEFKNHNPYEPHIGNKNSETRELGIGLLGAKFI